MIYVLNEDKEKEDIINYVEFNILVKYSNLDLTDYIQIYTGKRETNEYKHEFIGFDGNKKYSHVFLNYIVETDYIIM